MNYSTLVAGQSTPGSIKYSINYGLIDAEGILEEAQAWIYSKLRHVEMITTAPLAIAHLATTAARPTGYLDPISLVIPGYNHRIRLTDPQRFREMCGWDQDAVLPEGLATRWCDMNQTINFNTRSDAAYTAQLAFYKKPPLLSSSNETNWLTDRYPTLVRRACLMYAAEARKEYDSMDRAEVKALGAIGEIKVESDLALRGLELDFGWEGNE